MQELDNTELKEINGGSLSVAAIGCAVLGVSSGVLIGAALAVGVCYAVRYMCK